jgi:hypothetical protein
VTHPKSWILHTLQEQLAATDPKELADAQIRHSEYHNSTPEEDPARYLSHVGGGGLGWLDLFAIPNSTIVIKSEGYDEETDEKITKLRAFADRPHLSLRIIDQFDHCGTAIQCWLAGEISDRDDPTKTHIMQIDPLFHIPYEMVVPDAVNNTIGIIREKLVEVGFPLPPVPPQQ